MDNNRIKIRWDLQIQTDRQVPANQLDFVVVDKDQKIAVLIDVAIPNDSFRKEYEKQEKYQDLKGMWK